jgi:hypothetical protein
LRIGAHQAARWSDCTACAHDFPFMTACASSPLSALTIGDANYSETPRMRPAYPKQAEKKAR